MLKKLFKKKKGETVQELLRLKADARDNEWTQRFYNLIPEEDLYFDDLNPFWGPDNLPYVKLFLKPKSYTAKLPEISEHCITFGLGAVLIWEKPDEPDWVFSCGDIVSLANFGAILSGASVSGHEQYQVDQPEEVTVGNPSEKFLPSSIRAILKQDFQENFEQQNPGVFLMFNPKLSPPHSMVFSIEKSTFGGDINLFENAMQRIAWHLPKHCPATSISEGDFEYFPL